MEAAAEEVEDADDAADSDAELALSLEAEWGHRKLTKQFRSLVKTLALADAREGCAELQALCTCDGEASDGGDDEANALKSAAAALKRVAALMDGAPLLRRLLDTGPRAVAICVGCASDPVPQPLAR